MIDGELSGILIINKPGGMTSHTVVGKVRRKLAMKRVGHAGTLDPDATGVLVVMVGTATAASDFLMEHTKAYEATLLLGVTTDTEDSSGDVLTQSDTIPSKDEVIAACSAFEGDILQVPPMYSALKVNGRKLVDMARKGVTIEREPRKVTVNSIEAIPTDDARRYKLSVGCSKGTYIRTLCADIGKKLGCGAVMDTLVRTRSGDFSLCDATPLDDFEKMSADEAAALLIPTDRAFAALPSVTLEGETLKKSLNGVTVKTDIKDGEYRVYASAAFIALAEVTGGTLRLTKRF